MHRPGFYLVNGITLYRIISAPVLFFLIFTNHFEIFKWLLAISFFTDAIDGYFARRYKVVSVMGARLDSIGDDLTIAAAMTGVIILKPELLSRESTVFILLLILFVLQTVLAFIRYRKMSSFHTYAAKIAAILQGTFLLLLFFLDKPLYILFYIASAVTAIELVEEIILVLLLPQWETNVKGLYWVIRKPRNMVILVFGLPGAGKSHFASRLAEMIRADYINSDRVRKEMFKERTYSSQEKAAVYNEMVVKMMEAVDQKRNVVLDATFHKNDIRKLFSKAMEGKGGISFIEVQANEDITRERLKKERPYSEADFEVYKLIREHCEPLNEPHLLLESTDDNINNMLRKAADYLKWKDDKRTDQ